MTIKLLALGAMLPAEMEELERHFEVVRLWKEANPEAALREQGRDVRAILSTYNAMGVSRALIEALPNLELIAQYGAGVDNIDLRAAAEREILVSNTPGILTEDTADLAFALILALARRIVEGDLFVRVGKWHTGPLPLGVSLAGKRAGIVGMGRIGRAIARRAEAFGMDVAYHGPRAKADLDFPYYEDLGELAKASDFLVLACPGGKDTEGLVDARILKALGPKGYLVNIARGPVVREDDLLAALSSRTIAGAGLDVFWKEPNVPDTLFSMDNVVLSPHIGSATLETRAKMGQLVLDNLMAHFGGEALVTPVK